jgi:hypothetical protein
VLIDGGSGLNIMYIDTLDAMDIDRSRIQLIGVPFHGIVPGKQAKPLGQIDLSITFGDKFNFGTETLTFEVVSFHGIYNAVLRRSCYVKFMAVPNYTYLKLKMPSSYGIITVSTSFQCAYECDLECCELAAMTISWEELMTIREAVAKNAPDSKRWAKAFEPMEGTKEVPVNPDDPNGKVLRVGADLSPK